MVQKLYVTKKGFRKHRASCVGSKIGFRFLDQQSQAEKTLSKLFLKEHCQSRVHVVASPTV